MTSWPADIYYHSFDEVIALNSLTERHQLLRRRYLRKDVRRLYIVCVCPMRNTKEINITTGRIRTNKNDNPLETVNFEIRESNILLLLLLFFHIHSIRMYSSHKHFAHFYEKFVFFLNLGNISTRTLSKCLVIFSSKNQEYVLYYLFYILFHVIFIYISSERTHLKIESLFFNYK